jgi:hypothetical protein
MKTAATAWLCGTPRAGQPGDQAGLDDAGPARHRGRAADHRGQRVHHDDGGQAEVLAHRVQRRAQAQRDGQLAGRRPGQHVHDLPWLGGDRLQVGPDADQVRPYPLGGQPADPGYQGDHPGQYGGEQHHADDQPDQVLVAAVAGRGVEVAHGEPDGQQEQHALDHPAGRAGDRPELMAVVVS